MSTSIILNALNILKTKAPELAIEYGPKIAKQGSHAVDYIKDVLKINSKKIKVKKIEVKIDKQYMEIGKDIYINRDIKNIKIKDCFERIRDLEKEKETLKSEIKEVESKLKGNKVIDEIHEDIKEYSEKQKVKKNNSKTSNNKSQNKKNAKKVNTHGA